MQENNDNEVTFEVTFQGEKKKWWESIPVIGMIIRYILTSGGK